ncbi:DUF4397 domain-containing protein [Pedobacter yulinensis]|uniref:DUF4397 domain-containing protein n=1 Tax=Pedobacter yulinensis TaxID=2126353 RepID=A0A2T3HNG8_9SPHI|nr:DUF4397 domain-containing protein [Pedobacter yulinensis]PST83979.1 DUF4397 domain-containing protein [Pedobacter yulinensis]
MKIFSKIYLIPVLAMAIIAGCKKEEGNIFSDYELVDQSSMAFIKVNYNVAFRNNPAAQLKINGVRVSGANLQTRYPFPGGGFNTLGGSTGDYLPVMPGATQVSLSIPKRGTSIDSVNIYQTTVSAVAGKYYSLHVADTLNTKSLLVEEDYSLPDTASMRYRFVNLMANVPAVDLYNGTVKVASAIPFMGISEKFTLKFNTATPISWSVRVAGALPTSTALATYSNVNTALNQRVYTIFATGYNGVGTASTEPRRPFVALYYVK